MDSGVEKVPVDEVIGSFESPAQHHEVWRSPVLDGVASWQYFPSEAQLQAEEGERLILGVAVDCRSTENIARPS